MKILVTNDDGINSSGIIAAKDAVVPLGQITVSAPLTQQSGIGHALTLFEPIRVNKTRLNDGFEAYGVSGTPTDSMLVGMFEMGEKPDLVVSGINIGENLGKSELTTSGTIGATMEAASNNIPALAVSIEVDHAQNSIKFHEGKVDIDFTTAIKTTRTIAKKILKKGLPEEADFLNLNIPINPIDNEIITTKLGTRMYQLQKEKRIDPRGLPYYWLVGDPIPEDIDGTDVHILRNENKITLTPIKLDCTSNIEKTKKWL